MTRTLKLLFSINSNTKKRKTSAACKHQCPLELWDGKMKKKKKNKREKKLTGLKYYIQKIKHLHSHFSLVFNYIT